MRTGNSEIYEIFINDAQQDFVKREMEGLILRIIFWLGRELMRGCMMDAEKH